MYTECMERGSIMNKVKKVLFLIGVLLMVLLVQQPYGMSVGEPVIAKAATVKINKKKKTLKIGKTFQLKVEGTKQKVKWTSSDNSVATVDSVGKVTAKSAGTAIIKAEVEKKSFHCMIIIKGKAEESSGSDNKENTSAENKNDTGDNGNNNTNTNNNSSGGNDKNDNSTTSGGTTNNSSKTHVHQPCFIEVDKYYIELVKGQSIQMDVYTNCGPLYFVDSNPSIASLKFECRYDVHYPMVITANDLGITTIGIININDSSSTRWIAVHVKES